ncbi:hypothetical protein D3C83_235130 [compost metagenome]
MIREPVLDLLELRLGQASGALLAVARDEGQRRAFLEERDGRRRARQRPEFLEKEVHTDRG